MNKNCTNYLNEPIAVSGEKIIPCSYKLIAHAWH